MITFVPKSSNPSCLNDYRVAVMSVAMKALESTIPAHLNMPLDERKMNSSSTKKTSQ